MELNVPNMLRVGETLSPLRQHINFGGAWQSLRGIDSVRSCVDSVVWHEEQEASVHVAVNTIPNWEEGSPGVPHGCHQQDQSNPPNWWALSSSRGRGEAERAGVLMCP